MLTFKKKTLTDNVNVSKTHPLHELGRLLLYTALAMVGIYYVLGLAVDWVIPTIPPEQERAFFQKMNSPFEALPSLPEKNAVVQKIVDRLQNNIPEGQYKFQVKVIEDANVNAFALPGGNIVVCSALMDKIQSEDELAFVLAHEMGHVTNRDHLKSMGRMLVFLTASRFFFGPDNTINKFIFKSTKLSEVQFSKQQELNADLFGLELMQKAYGHSGGGIRFFERELLPNDRSNGFLQFLSTHPGTGDRVQIMQKIIRDRGYTD